MPSCCFRIQQPFGGHGCIGEGTVSSGSFEIQEFENKQDPKVLGDTQAKGKNVLFEHITV
jgi:hypothetical protein